ncbi:YchJ family protein [Nocardia arizonensis]|uniref:YchJ family protein n=1 Tax=Nocardia arizonensis TaxID=1141647 RepID=UPI0006D2C953|nr:YchJ family protein [Nocardia arizonensis]
MSRSHPCPCRRGDSYADCCGPLLAGARPAPTAAALMRSRYTAFALGDIGYLRRSWHSGTRPRDIELDADQRWLFLEIVRTERGGPFDDTGTVEFVAHYRGPGGRGELREVSRFVREDGAWVYLDGVVRH